MKLYGPPGTGKTLRLTRLAIRAVELHGPDRVMATTFTRAAAEELKLRIATALGYQASLPADTWARRRALDRWLPWVGTTHSLSLKLAGRPRVVSAKDLTDFARALGSRRQLSMPEVDDLEGYAWAEPGRDEIEIALALNSGARHRQEPAATTWARLGAKIGLDRALYIIEAYNHFKQDLGKIDFEDMLLLGRDEKPPVAIGLFDEVQDNSPLLWSVVDAWSAELDSALAGDPYQAIYLFSGAEPRLFIDHPGELRPLGDSHRLTPDSAIRAQHILRGAGYSEGDWLGTWTGVGEGASTDGSVFWLARTQRLLSYITGDFEHMGVPYGYMRGGGQLQTKAADAYRAVLRLQERGALPVTSVSAIAEQMERGWLPYGEKARLERLAKADPEMILEPEEIEAVWGMPVHDWAYHMQRGAYFMKVMGRCGKDAFLEPPRTRLGTIHAAKGREADEVHLITSWATLPYQATLTPEGKRAECCVAYVGATRHRKRLVLETGSEGTPYDGFFMA